MSAQTDCEMLSIEVMEAYAGKYNIKLVLNRLWSL